MTRAVFVRLTLGVGLLGAHRASAAPAKAPAEKSFAADPRFQTRITVRVAGMTLHEILPQLGRLAGTPLAAAPEVAEQKVVVFAEALPAGEVLDALTAMLNLAPEGGYSWAETGRGETRGLRLSQSLRARSEARSRLVEAEREMLRRLHTELRKIAEDPQKRRAALDPAPDASFGRASFVASQLTRKQLERLLEEGSLVLRAGELPAEHRRVLHLMEGDLRRRIEPDLQANPHDELLLRMTRDLNPAEFSLMLELRQMGTSLLLSGIFRPGWDKPGIGITLHPSQPDPETLAQPAAGAPDEPPLLLAPARWNMAETLAEVARRSGLPLVSDCYWLYWFDLSYNRKAGLTQVLSQVDRVHRFRSERRQRFLLVRSRDPYQRQSEEASLETAVQCAARIEQEGAVSLDLLAELPPIEAVQLAALADAPELQSRSGRAAVQAFNLAHVVMPALVRLYAQLSPEQRRAVQNDGCRLPFAQMSPRQRAACVLWLRQRHPALPDAAYAETTLTLQVTADRRLEVRWEGGGEQKSREFHLDLLRVSAEGMAFPELPVPVDLRGRPAPPIRVLRPDGTLVTLGPTSGVNRALLFWRRWGTPYVGSGTGVSELEPLAKLLRDRPELAARTAVIVPDLNPAELRKWSEILPAGLPLYSDPEGAAAGLYGATRHARAVRITPDGRVAEIVMGYEAIGTIPWDRWLG